MIDSMLTRRSLFIVLSGLPVVLLGILPERIARAEDSQILQLERVISIDKVGDGQVSLVATAPTEEMYQEGKESFAKEMDGKMTVLLRRLGAGHHWAEMDDVDGQLNDDRRELTLTYNHRGIARALKGDRWRILFESDADVDVVSSSDRELVFTTLETSELGLSRLVIKIQLPEGATEARYKQNPPSIDYRLPVVADVPNARTSVDFELESKPSIMSSLAKSHSLDVFPYFWTAKQVFRNTGATTVSDYRVRFRINGYSSWSPWKKSPRVVPGATVVDAFFPILDIDKVAAATGSRPVALEMEMEYRDPDGTLVQESDTRRLELLARNDVTYSSMTLDEAHDFYDNFDYGGMIAASFVTAKDPVIQQFAGAIAQSVGGTGAAFTDAEAIKFVAAIHQFLATNNIAYQSPPGLLVDGQVRQHVKYGRDVLRNRAGTCIDLAILYASACKAVGLRPFIVMVPGHCFMAVRLPSGTRLPVETTMMKEGQFIEAVKAGEAQLVKAEKGPVIITDIYAMRDEGVWPLDLPKMSDTFLKDKGYKITPLNIPENNDEKRPESPNAAVAGKWIYQGRVSGIDMQLAVILQLDGNYAGYARMAFQNGRVQEVNDQGTYRLDGNVMVAVSNTGETFRRAYEVKDGKLHVTYNELNATIGFQRVEE